MAELTGDLHLIGSAALARELIAAGLVDELRLMVDPVVLGGGKRIWPSDGGPRSFSLVGSEAAPPT
ncbi:dihydrofolate reductase family protein [Micromonospora sp. NPDC050200]|uniref:dihydrofolate reductase family protein n=1 Tax=Micromonospora sp. NPDC050200 TaxID=3155664 RepID=UPI0033E8BE12